jgi:hypothetical protein
VIRLPLTEYLRFELGYGYPSLEKAGDHVKILEVPEGEPPPVPMVDFWLFDDRLPVRMDYDDEGHLLEAVEITDPAAVEECRQVRDLALSLAIPYAVWFPRAREAGQI